VAIIRISRPATTVSTTLIATVWSVTGKESVHFNMIALLEQTLGACDFFDLFVFCARLTERFFNFHKAVILSEAPSRSIAQPTACGAESKDLGDDHWQMFFRAFQPQTTTESKKVTTSGEAEGSAVQRTPLGNVSL
jgi:hypothetical protein